MFHIFFRLKVILSSNKLGFYELHTTGNGTKVMAPVVNHAAT
jgi:hypothetical protein